MVLSHTGPEPEPAGRRPSGTLEAAVLAVLWEAGRPLNPGEVRELLRARAADSTTPTSTHDAAAAELSYSTVVTILTRLYEKKSLSRQREGRAFRYAPVADEAGLAARRLAALLDTAPDRTAVLSRFVEDLSDRDEELLRALLGGRPAPDTPSS
ncbi:MAG TPA: BlaI/MecI/CopY family transcriptional regulator [Actinocrinis sp.]|nr:BlaI/MecI/CopY family transcriptional regulator [Actinocrinis sp.]